MPRNLDSHITSRSTDSRQTNLPLLTVSSVGDLLGCSKKYEELRVLKNWPKGRTVPSSVPRGSAWHETLRALHAARWNNELPLADLETYAQTAVHAARYDRNVDRAYEVKRVVEMAKLFCDSQDPEDIEAIIALETQVEFDYHFKGGGLARIAATIDRALIRPEAPNVLVLQDFKSTRQQINLAECFILIWAGSHKWPGYEYTLELIWVDAEEGQVDVDVITADAVRTQHKLITSALLKRLSTEPVAESGPSCTFCPLRDNCQGLPAVQLGESDEPF
jgi:hypothetical protein